MFLGLFVPSGLTALFTMTSATPILSKDAAQSVCGTIDLKNGVSQMLYAGACYELQGPARAVHVNSACDCEFFP